MLDIYTIDNRSMNQLKNVVLCIKSNVSGGYGIYTLRNKGYIFAEMAKIPLPLAEFLN